MIISYFARSFLNMMRDPMRAPSLLLVLMAIAILQLRGCSANLEIHQSPISQVTTLGGIAKFNCSASDGTFELIINELHIWDDKSFPEHGITAVISDVYNQETDEVDYTAMVTVEATTANNNTVVRCVVSSYNGPVWSETATLSVIGSPDPPAMLGVPRQHLNLEARQFSAVWVAPFSHIDHPILHYTVNVTNLRNLDSYEQSTSVESLMKTSDNVTSIITLEFPRQTRSCDYLVITVTAVNDIQASDPSSANISIPEVPESGLSVSTDVLFQNDGTPVVTLKIKFPKLCPFQLLNYTVYLRNRTQNVHQQFVMLHKSVTDPPESVTETIGSGVVANTNYSLVVVAGTEVWNTSTAPYNFSTHFTPKESSAPLIDSPKSTGMSRLVLGIIAGSMAFLLLITVVVATLLLFACLRKRRAGSSTSVEEMKIGSVPYNLTPNPIYDGPLYDTVHEPLKQMSTLKTQPHPLPDWTEPLYSESPTENKKRNAAGSDYEEVTLRHKDTEDCYIHMQSYKQQ